MVEAYVLANIDLLSDPKNSAGLWLDGEESYFDVSVTVANRLLKTQVTTTSATFGGIDAGDPPSLAFYKLPHHRADGKGRHISMSVPIRDPKLLARAEQELRRGDEIEVTIETRWAEEGIPKTLLNFSKVSVPQEQVLVAAG